MFAASKTASVSGGYQISRSLRFNSADASNLNRTPASAANQQIWTFSIWLKRSRIGADYEGIFSSGNGTDQIRFENNDVFRFGLNGSSSADFLTTQVFRDVSAWYHIVVAVDTTQATSTNRVKIYVNGTQVTSFSTANYPSQNYNTFFNNTADHRIGSATTSSFYFNGYMTEFNWIGGQQLTPSSFGNTDAQTGVWGPKAYSGSYGTNGFYLNFSDNSNTTAATLGKDYSGNSNNWTPNNFSVTAGAGNDSLVDVPTNFGVDTGAGGTVRGNYSTLNPLNKGGTHTLTNGNLDFSISGATGSTSTFGTIGVSSGKWYWEMLVASTDGVYYPGLGVETNPNPALQSGGTSTGFMYLISGQKYNNGSLAAYGSSYTTNNVIGVALDMDAGTITFYKNNTSQGQAFSGITGTAFPALIGQTGGSGSFNFGQRPFAYTAPSGFKALNTQNLPTPTIGATTATQAEKFFNTILWSGTGAGTRSLSVGFQPDWVWTKTRNSSAQYHALFDSVRGGNKTLFSNATLAENVNSASGYISSFDSNGFSVIGGNDTNASGLTYVGWNWKAGGTAVTNTAGSITSTVSANTTSGFSVVTYTGTGANATVGHGIGIAPRMVIVKSRSTPASSYTAKWHTYHASLGASSIIWLNATDAASTSANYWNATAPTSSVFSVGTDIYGPNVSGVTYVAYCFAPVAGYSAFGSYTGNGSADGTFVFTGFRPAWVMIKRSDSTSNWTVLDFRRLGYNVDNNPLFPNLSDVEGTTDLADLLSNGFKLRTADASVNASGGTYIFMALAEAPQKFSLAR